MTLMKCDDEETKMCAAASLVNITGSMVVSGTTGAGVNMGGDERQVRAEKALLCGVDVRCCC